ncbi:MAG: hypothetical protein SH850_29920 [Planctomycetaceae bacterium]|nr:hypothetical protein [Planctomycetaceae bacterium]
MWFTEDPWPPMFVCGLAALLAVAYWSNSKRVLHLVLAVGLLALGAIIYVAEQVLVTPAEQVEALVAKLCDDFRHKSPATLDHFSDSAPELKLMCQGAMALVEIKDDLRLTDMSTKLTNDDSRAVCHFRANAGLSVAGFGDVGHQPARFELTWAKEPAGWKIITVRRLHPIRNEELSLLEKSAG